MLISSNQIIIFLVQLAVLLGFARAMGEVARRFRQPAVVGEIIAGVLLGKTVLGWLSPDVFNALFPHDITNETMLRSVEIIGLLLLLLVAGLEIDLRIVWRQGRLTILTGIASVIVPFLLGFLLAYAFPGLKGASHENNLAFALLLGTAMTISAIPVIVRVLLDLDIFKSDLGTLIMAAAIFCNLIAWLLVSLVMGIFLGDDSSGLSLLQTLLLTGIFVGFCMTAARKLINHLIGWVQENLPWPGGMLTIMCVLAFLGASISEAIGIQAIFGAFIVGVVIGESPRLREQTRQMVHDFVTHVFAPIVFAAPMIHVNFFSSFRLEVVLGILVIACFAKVAGSAIGARLGGLDKTESLAVGAGLNARGEMGIILAVIARQYGLIDERIFVALVIMALVTSLLSAPLIMHFLRVLRPYALRKFITSEGFIGRLKGRSAREAIRELCDAAANLTDIGSKRLFNAAWKREQLMSTGIGEGVAVPHARIKGLSKPYLIIGRSPRGIDFDAPDGKVARLIFLLLTPKDDQGAQVQMLANIARIFHDPKARDAAMEAKDFDEIKNILDKE